MSAPTTRTGRPRAASTRTAGVRAASRGSTKWSRATLNASERRAPRHVDRLIRRSGARRAPFVLLVAGLLAGGLCALLALNTAAAAAELRRHDLQNANAGLAADVQQATTELAARQAPAALARAAARLGMVPDSDPAFLQLRPGGSAVVLGSPAPARAPAPPSTPKPTAKPTVTPTTKPTAKPTTKPTSKPSRKATATPPANKKTPSPTPTARGQR